MAQQATLIEYGRGDQAESIALTDQQSAAVNTALNRVEKYDIYEYGENLERSILPEATEALEAHIEVLEGVKGKATLYDPNDENIYLKWNRSALEELEDATAAS